MATLLVEYDLVDRPFGATPRYQGYDFEHPSDARLVTPHREPVRPTQLEFDYIWDSHTLNVMSGTRCDESCGICNGDALRRHDNSLFPGRQRPYATR